jgi:ribosome biogenesis GTPase
VLLTSATLDGGMPELKEALQGKVTLLCGHSGVGKSSLINKIISSLALKVRSVSEWSGKGMHTTTFADTYELPSGGRIIDTPGIREFGIVDMEQVELSHYFIEMQPYIGNCAFSDCLHTDEPGCAIRAAVDAARIHVERYISYLNILSTIETRNY